jgi:energy-converting hydrogenase Eha subunit E
MDLRLIDYPVYIAASVVLTIWVGNTLYKNGRPFLVSVFKEEGLADSVNRLLVVGFYLVNFGAAAILINTGGAPDNVPDMLKQTVTRIGVVLLVLGFMHFSNVLTLRSIRRRDKPMPPVPVNPNPYQWTPPPAPITPAPGA